MEYSTRMYNNYELTPLLPNESVEYLHMQSVLLKRLDAVSNALCKCNSFKINFIDQHNFI